MLASMSLSMFRQWRAYYDLEPWGEERADLRIATVTKMVHDVNVKKRHRDRPLSDFTLDIGKRTPFDHRSKPHQDRMRLIGAMIAGAHKEQ